MDGASPSRLRVGLLVVAGVIVAGIIFVLAMIASAVSSLNGICNPACL